MISNHLQIQHKKKLILAYTNQRLKILDKRGLRKEIGLKMKLAIFKKKTLKFVKKRMELIG